MGFDLSKNNLSQKAEQGYKFELELPDVGTRTGAYLTIRGDKSPTVQNYMRKLYNERQMKEKALRARGREPDAMTVEELEDMAIEGALVRLIDWEGIEEEGKELKFSEANARRVLKEHAWIREAILTESETVTNFM